MPIEIASDYVNDQQSFTAVLGREVAPVSRRTIIGFAAVTAVGILTWDTTAAVRASSPSRIHEPVALVGASDVARRSSDPSIPWSLSIVRGTTSVNLTVSELGLFPSHSVNFQGHLWTGPAVFDIVVAVGATLADQIQLQTTSVVGASLYMKSLVGGGVIVALKRDGRTVPPTLTSANPGILPQAWDSLPLRTMKVVS